MQIIKDIQGMLLASSIFTRMHCYENSNCTPNLLQGGLCYKQTYKLKTKGQVYICHLTLFKLLSCQKMYVKSIQKEKTDFRDVFDIILLFEL